MTGHGLAPGYMHTLTLHRQSFSRRPSPYPSECRYDWTDDVQLPSSVLGTIPYDVSLCQSFCLDSYVQTDCGCTVLSIIELDRNLSDPCNIVDEEVYDCIIRAFNNASHMANALEEM